MNNHTKEDTMPVAVAAGLDFERLTHDFDDPNRTTADTVARQLLDLPTITNIHTHTDYSGISQGHAPERSTITREDGGSLDFHLTIDLDIDERGVPGATTITGWVITTGGDTTTHPAEGSLRGLLGQLRKWAANLPGNDAPILHRHLDGPLGGEYTLAWKPARVPLRDGGEATLCDRTNFPPTVWTRDPYTRGEIMNPGIFHTPDGRTFTFREVATLADLTPGTFVLLTGRQQIGGS